MSLYPLLLEPIYKEKIWGGRTLERLGRHLPGGASTSIGESWELADLGATSASGGGGEAAHSRIRNGPLIKRTLGEVARDFGPLVTGGWKVGDDGAFPLLLKYLDARENLSVQVHPSPTYAAAHPDAHLKSEAWYVVAAEPGSTIYKGVAPGVTPETFAAAIADGTVPELLVQIPARAGDCHYLPSGTCHALGAGILVAEVQTPSDTTFRVFDWGRTDRELHVDAAMACIDFGPGPTRDHEPGTPIVDGDAAGRDLVACEHFSIREWTVLRDGAHGFSSDRVSVIMLIEGGGSLHWGADLDRTLAVAAGDTVVLPAALSVAELRTGTDTRLLEVTPPAAD